MNRLTKKIEDLDFYKISSAYINEIPNLFLDKDYVGEAINKLGKLETLLENYNIDTLEELELILGKYAVSNDKLFSIPLEDLKNYKITKDGKIYSIEKQIYLKQLFNKDGYVYYIIKGKQRLAHRLVAITFIPNPNNYKEINHKNEIKNDNRMENLEWCSRQYNATYNNCHLRHSEWERKPICQYDLEGNFIKEWSYAKEIEDSGIAKGNLVKQCCRNKLCQTSGFVWRFKGDTFENRKKRKEYDRTKNLGNRARKQKI